MGTLRQVKMVELIYVTFAVDLFVCCSSSFVCLSVYFLVCFLHLLVGQIVLMNSLISDVFF